MKLNERVKEYLHLPPPMFIAFQLTIAKLWSQLRLPSTDNWLKKKWYVHIVEYYSATRRNQVLCFATKQMQLEAIVLHEISQFPKDIICFLSTTNTWSTKNAIYNESDILGFISAYKSCV